jgi:DNA modification methylase
MTRMTIFETDCLNVELGQPADLIYLDPPYGPKGQDDYYGVGSSREEYLSWMGPRLKKFARQLSPNGNILLHIDWKNVHYLKVMMDSIFGEDNFLNEIVWCFSGPSVAKSALPRKHQTILWYGRGKHTFNSPRIPYKALSVGGETSWSGKKLDVEKYLARGKLLEDWWIDIPSLQRNEKEKTGYATQKPNKLLDRIIQTFSKVDDLVYDPMMGSGTTLEAAIRNGRRAAGADISPEACKITKERLELLAQS